MNVDLASTKDILKDSRHNLLEQANVVATGIGYKITQGQQTSNLSIICSVAEKLPESRLSSKDIVPQTINGIPS